MFLTITSETAPATDLGYLLHKNPASIQELPLTMGTGRIYYSEASEERCTCVLQIDVDPIAQVRDRSHGKGDGRFALAQYVNDRPYVASSYLSVAIAQAFGTALGGRSKERPELAATPLALTVSVAAVRCPRGEEFLRSLFEPLGYEIEIEGIEIDASFPEWEQSRYFFLKLRGEKLLREILAHLYVLIPVLDDAKHYWVAREEVDKLLRHGEGWLEEHPEKEWIVDRYLRRFRSLTTEAFERLAEGSDPETEEEAQALPEERIERPMSLHQQRIGAVLTALRSLGARTILDLGCGDGKLLQELLRDKAFTRILGVDVSVRSLEKAKDRLKLDRMRPAAKERISLAHGSVIYRDPRFAGFDAAVLVEVIEHLELDRLPALERVVFGSAQPTRCIVTTPNREYNVRFETLPADKLRHGDHRFEWTRAEFLAWCEKIAAEYPYRFRTLPLGPEDPEVGAPSQMAIFER